VNNPPTYVNTSPFAVSWSGSDTSPGSGLAGFNVQSKAGAAGTWTDWRVGTPGTANTTENFSGTDGTQYFFRVQAVDNAGNTQAAYGTPGSGVLVDLTLPSSSVNALPTYTTSAGFNVTWTGSDTSGGTASGINCYDVQYSKDGGAWTAWQSCTTSVSASFTSTGNGTYAFRSRAKDNAGNWENWPGSADTQTIVDTTPPSFTSVNDGPGADIDFSASSNTIEANWAASDSDTGIGHYEYAIGTTSGGTNVVNWTTIGTNTSLSKNGLTLTHNSVYYVTIRAYNAAGLFTDQPSDGVKIDLMPPTTSMSAPNSPYMGTTNFNVAWSGADGAGESGLTTYTIEYKTVGLSGWTAWQTNTSSTSGTFSGINGYTYQFRTIAKDAVGNTTPYPTSPDYQVETTVDTSNLPAPANISEGSETDPDAEYTSITSSFSGHWDAVSGAARSSK